MAQHRGWKFDPANTRLAAQFDGTEVFDFDSDDMVVTAPLTLSSTLALSGAITVADDIAIGAGTGNTAKLLWETADANANELILELPAGGSTDVPVLVIGDTLLNDDLGQYNGVVSTVVAIHGSTATATGPSLTFKKSRGTNSAPTVVTSADDMGSIDFYGAVATDEYVRGARILGEMTGTIATTRGPGVLTFQTATDAAPSVLTTAMTISAAQLVTVAAGLTVTTGAVTVSGTTETTGAGTGIVIVAGGLAADKKLATGKASGTTGAVLFTGTTSGVVTLSVADAAGTWTMKLPAAVGSAGQQLTDAGGDGVTSWAAASLGEWKNDLGVLDPEEALKAVISAPTHIFTYNKDVLPVGQWDGNGAKFAGIFAEEAPWAMHGERDGIRSGVAFSMINSFGYARAAIQALADKVARLEGALA